MSNSFSQRLLGWFEQHGRKDLPWQQNISPYRVWVSEIMLQQTQVATVIPYYQRFMETFPTVEALARAPLDQLLHHWTGLGYYARARNMHKAAQLLIEQFNGQLPSTVDQLETLPGIGRSTAGAISAIAFQQPAVILDGNVKRVLARFHAIDGWPGTTAASQKLWQLAEQLTPKQRTADYTQAIMDLGATLCTRTKPQCELCPINTDCRALAQGNPTGYPGKKPRRKQPVKQSLFLILKNSAGDILLEQRPESGLWGGLWVFPECQTETEIDTICHRLGCRPISLNALPAQRHTFSHFHLDYSPIIVSVDQLPGIMDSNRLVWYNPNTALFLGTAQPIKKLLETLT